MCLSALLRANSSRFSQWTVHIVDQILIMIPFPMQTLSLMDLPNRVSWSKMTADPTKPNHSLIAATNLNQSPIDLRHKQIINNLDIDIDIWCNKRVMIVQNFEISIHLLRFFSFLSVLKFFCYKNIIWTKFDINIFRIWKVIILYINGKISFFKNIFSWFSFLL